MPSHDFDCSSCRVGGTIGAGATRVKVDAAELQSDLLELVPQRRAAAALPPAASLAVAAAHLDARRAEHRPQLRILGAQPRELAPHLRLGGGAPTALRLRRLELARIEPLKVALELAHLRLELGILALEEAARALRRRRRRRLRLVVGA